MIKMIKGTIVALTLVALFLVMNGCGAVQGLGDDIKWIGQKGSEMIQ